MEIEDILPKVSPEASEAVKDDMKNASGNNWFYESLANIRAENRFIAELLEIKAKDSNEPLKLLYCAVLLYKLLEKQAKLDISNLKISLN